MMMMIPEVTSTKKSPAARFIIWVYPDQEEFLDYYSYKRKTPKIGQVVTLIDEDGNNRKYVVVRVEPPIINLYEPDMCDSDQANYDVDVKVHLEKYHRKKSKSK